MAIRQTRHIIKNSNIPNKPLPSSLLLGEPIVNTADGIMYFSGNTTSIPSWTPSSGTGIGTNYFEVGSNLYDLQLRNKITRYQGLTGSSLVGKFLSGTSTGFVLADTSDIQGVDTYVTGGTYSNASGAYNGGTATFRNNLDAIFQVTGFTDIYLTGGTYTSGTATFRNNSGGTFLVTGFTTTDTFVTGFTYNPVTNAITLSQNQGQADRIITISAMSGLTVNGGLTVGGDVAIGGNLTVLGATISAFTSQLYVEDPNLILNYNPTGSTILTSSGAGFTIQDGSGIGGSNVTFDIHPLNTLTGLTPTQIPSITEYSAPTGYANRGWVTQLNDIVLRSTNTSTPNGVRVICEFDVLDGGTF